MNCFIPYCLVLELRIMNKGNKVIFANRYTGNWVIISKESYLFVKKYIQKKLLLMN